jgi:hypothetical protein
MLAIAQQTHGFQISGLQNSRLNEYEDYCAPLTCTIISTLALLHVTIIHKNYYNLNVFISLH